MNNDCRKELDMLCALNSDLRFATRELQEKLKCAIEMLADWCVAIEENGTSWDSWDEHYKDARYRNNILREDLDKEINAQLKGLK